MRKLFALSAVMTKQEPGSQVTTLMQGWTFAESKEAAIGRFLRDCKEAKPDFAVLDIMAMEIPADQVSRIAAEQAGSAA